MKKNLTFILTLIALLTSCSATIESPVIYISNASDKPIKNINCQWVGQNLSLPELSPGDSRSQSFYIRKNSDFFGMVRISWNNSKGNKIEREFFFLKNHLPSISDRTTYNYAQLYLDQTGMEIISSDAPDLSGKISKMDALLLSHKDQHQKSLTKSSSHQAAQQVLPQLAPGTNLITVTQLRVDDKAQGDDKTTEGRPESLGD